MAKSHDNPQYVFCFSRAMENLRPNIFFCGKPHMASARICASRRFSELSAAAAHVYIAYIITLVRTRFIMPPVYWPRRYTGTQYFEQVKCAGNASTCCRERPAVTPRVVLCSPVGIDPLQAQAWLKRRVLSAIERCPQKAIVVLDNTQVLSGSDLLLLDTFLLLFDDGL